MQYMIHVSSPSMVPPMAHGRITSPGKCLSWISWRWQTLTRLVMESGSGFQITHRSTLMFSNGLMVRC